MRVFIIVETVTAGIACLQRQYFCLFPASCLSNSGIGLLQPEKAHTTLKLTLQISNVPK